MYAARLHAAPALPSLPPYAMGAAEMRPFLAELEAAAATAPHTLGESDMWSAEVLAAESRGSDAAAEEAMAAAGADSGAATSDAVCAQRLLAHPLVLCVFHHPTLLWCSMLELKKTCRC